jgi:hypothetical protein
VGCFIVFVDGTRCSFVVGLYCGFLWLAWFAAFFGWLGLLVIELAITLWCKFTMHYAKCVETLADVEGTKV